ncbi:MAG: hypothetical protein ACRDK3_07185 [Actinomycetota bacterium]
MPIPLLITLLVVVPGLGATLAVFKAGQARLPTQIACVFGLGLGTVAGWGFVLVLLRSFNPVTCFGGVALLTLVFFYSGYRRSGLRERATALREEIRTDGWLTGIGFIAAVVIAFATLQGQSSLLNLGRANPLRYWADGLEIADAGQVPDATLQWGQLFAPTVSKLSFNAFNAAFSFLTDDPLELLAPLLSLALIGSIIAGWALGRELGLRYSAPLMAILAGASSGVFRASLTISPQRWYGAETFARLALVTGLILAINALRNQGRPLVAVVAGIAFGIAGTIHLVPTSVGIGFLCAYALWFLLVERSFRHVLKVGLVAGGIFSAFVLAGLALSGGDAAFNAVDQNQGIDTRGGTFDPTRYLAGGRVNQPPYLQPGSRIEMNDGWYELPGTIFEEYVAKSTTSGLSRSGYTAIFLGVGVVALLLLFLAPKPLRPLAAAGFVTWAGLLMITITMSSTYDTYVPASFAQRRLWSYDAFMLLLVGLGVVEVALYYLARVRVWIPILAIAIGVCVAVALNAPQEIGRYKRKQGADTLRAMNWISENLPCDARILVNQRTGGTFQVFTGRVAITEGMAPYLRPDMLTQVIDILLDTRSFFEAPSDNYEVLERYGIDHVVVAKRPYLFHEKPLLGQSPPELLAEAEELEQIHESRLIDVYRVPDAQTAGRPQAEEHAGYRCRTEALNVPPVEPASS